jgi:hypothetical protein
MDTTKKACRLSRRFSPKVTVWDDGIISINRTAIERFGLQEMKFATLSFAPNRLAFSIKPSGDEDSALPVLRYGSQPPVIEAQDFLEENGFDYAMETFVYDAQWDEANKAILVKIDY